MPAKWVVHEGKALDVMRELDDESVDCCVTSPPYWRMRDYGHDEQLGMEPVLGDFIARLADIFDEVRRVLKPTGTCWVNIGDCYARRGGGRAQGSDMGRRYIGTPGRMSPGLKSGDLVGVPWALAFAMRDRGWYVRGEQVWAKTNGTPESTGSRPQRQHEHVFLFTRSPSPEYFYDGDAVRTELAPKTLSTYGTERTPVHSPDHNVRAARLPRLRWQRVDEHGEPVGAALRSVWPIAGRQNRERIEHFAMMPHLLAEICVRAGCPAGGVVLDPFAGSGTTGVVAIRLGCGFVGIELVPKYAELAREQIRDDAPLLNPAAELGTKR